MQLESQKPLPSAATSGSSSIAESAAIPTPTAALTHFDKASSNSLLVSFGKPADEKPVVFGAYQVLKEIAHGGMGVVYLARHIALGREVALKTIRSGSPVKPELVSRFYQEAQAVALLKHPHIVQVYDFGVVAEQHYFTMALAQGGSLLNCLKSYQADGRSAVVLMEKVARAVQHIHEHGLLHRDLKPGNILLDGGEPLVSDFGLAKSLESDLELTRSGAALGTPSYMAPEQAAGRSDRVGPQTDIWALGVILYELLCGSKPFTGQSREEVIRAIQEDEPSAPRSVSPSLDRNLEAILQKCLEKEPARRYRSAGALADDLGAWLRGEPIRARPLGRVGRAVRWVRRHRLVTMAAALAGTLALTGFLIVDRFDPDRTLRPLQRALLTQQNVTLLGPTGPPAWSQWQVPGAMLSRHVDETFSLHSGNRSLLALLPNIPWERFRLNAEVKQATSHEGGTGIYVAHESFPAADGPYHGFIGLTFNETGKLRLDENGKPRAQAQLRAFHHYEPRLGTFVLRNADLAPPHFWPPREPGDAHLWRSLALEVTLDQITAYLDGNAIGKVTTQQKLRHAKIMTMHKHTVIEQMPGFPSSGGLGLLVDNGIASFRNVEIRRLPD